MDPEVIERFAQMGTGDGTRRSSRRTEIVRQAQDAHAAVFLQREKRLVAGHYGLRPARDGAFEDAVVGRVLQYGEAPARFDDRRDVGEKERDAGKLFSVPGKLAGKNAKKLIQDRPGKKKLILL